MSQQIVEAVKADLEARGVSVVGPCGAFQIVKRVAWVLRATGAGLLSKPSGNNCEGFAVDIIAFPDGVIFDILGNGGGDEDAQGHPIPGTGNHPQWNPPSDGQPVDPGRWRAPIDPGDTLAPIAVTPTTTGSSGGAAGVEGPPSSSALPPALVAQMVDVLERVLIRLKRGQTYTLAFHRTGRDHDGNWQYAGTLTPAEHP